MDQVPRVQVFKSFQHLINDVLLVYFFQDVCADDCVQVGLHLVEHAVDVLVIFSTDHIQETDDILVPVELLQEHDFSVGPLCVCSILEGIKYFL